MTVTITLPLVRNYIMVHPGCTQLEMAAKFPTGDKVYGSHKFVAGHVATLRRIGQVADVPRCQECGAALTRGHRNTPLYYVGKGNQ